MIVGAMCALALGSPSTSHAATGARDAPVIVSDAGPPTHLPSVIARREDSIEVRRVAADVVVYREQRLDLDPIVRRAGHRREPRGMIADAPPPLTLAALTVPAD
jgi:hypothetical protein